MRNTVMGVVIGRFQGTHSGHQALLKYAAERCDRLLIILGSDDRAPSPRNPWSSGYRIEKLRQMLVGVRASVIIRTVGDFLYSDARWKYEVSRIIQENNESEKVVLFGHQKPGNSYLEWFQDSVDSYSNFDSGVKVSATDIRRALANGERRPEMVGEWVLPENVMADFEYYEKERQLFASYPFPETLNFNCADVVLVCSYNVALVKRKFSPGKDCWALPGGFKNAKETFLDCAIRELIEETGPDIPEKVLRGSIKTQKLFDSPERSFGIPRNTRAFLCEVRRDNLGKLPKLKPQIETSEVKWFPLPVVLNELALYDDHKDIIRELVRV